MGMANESCEITSGGVTMAAITNAITMKYTRNALSCYTVTMLKRTNSITTIGT